jgi:hypothetical protein
MDHPNGASLFVDKAPELRFDKLLLQTRFFQRFPHQGLHDRPPYINLTILPYRIYRIDMPPNAKGV